MYKQVLSALLLSILFLAGCAKIKIGDPVVLSGCGEKCEDVPVQTEIVLPPKFKNGDVVRHKMLDNDMLGIVMQGDYKYIPRLKTYYCIVDFYPSSAAIHIDFSKFDNYERRYVYEYELTKTQMSKIPARWDWQQYN